MFVAEAFINDVLCWEAYKRDAFEFLQIIVYKTVQQTFFWEKVIKNIFILTSYDFSFRTWFGIQSTYILLFVRVNTVLLFVKIGYILLVVFKNKIY